MEDQHWFSGQERNGPIFVDLRTITAVQPHMGCFISGGHQFFLTPESFVEFTARMAKFGRPIIVPAAA